MVDKESCIKALRDGKALVNVHGGTCLVVFGKQYGIKLGKARRGRPYSFSNPMYWIAKELSLPEKLKIMWRSEVCYR